MSDIQKEMFDNDLDPIRFELLDPLNRAKDAYKVLGKYADEMDKKKINRKSSKYQKLYAKFEEYYEDLSNSDKRAFEKWKEDHNYQW